jgi:radical SAM superfamily enzyme YgiQ (UPF0313 family)
MTNHKLNPKKLAQILIRYNARNNIIGIGAHSNINVQNTYYTLKLIKTYAPKCTVIMGGYHATFFSKRWVQYGVDIVIRNEGDITYPIIVKKIQNWDTEKISDNDLMGTTYNKEWLEKFNQKTDYSTPFREIKPKDWNIIKKRKKFVNTSKKKKKHIFKAPDRPFIQDLNQIPFPTRHLLDYKKNFLPINGPGYATTIEGARGCPYNCEYCSTKVMWKKTPRYKSAARLIEEIKECYNLGFQKFFFVDESWGVNIQRDKEFIRLLKEEKLSIKWIVQIRVDTIVNNPDLIRDAAKVGLSVAMVGFETLDQNMIDFCHKGTKVHDYVNVRKILKENQILTLGYFLVGLPNETRIQRLKTMQASKSLSDMSFLQPFVPYFEGAMDPDHTAQKMSVFDALVRKRSKNWKVSKFTKEINRDLIKHIMLFTFNPRNLAVLLLAKSPRMRHKREFLKHYYSSLLKSLFNFRPIYLLNLFWGLKYPAIG